MNRFEQRQSEMRDTLLDTQQHNDQKRQTFLGMTQANSGSRPTLEDLPRLRVSFEVGGGSFPGFDHVNLKYFIHFGPTWNLESGSTAGVSHCVSRRTCGNLYKTPNIWNSL